MQVKYIKELEGWTGSAALFRLGPNLIPELQKFCVISNTSVLGIPETMAFECDEHGEHVEFSGLDVGGKYTTINSVIEELEALDSLPVEEE